MVSILTKSVLRIDRRSGPRNVEDVIYEQIHARLAEIRSRMDVLERRLDSISALVEEIDRVFVSRHPPLRSEFESTTPSDRTVEAVAGTEAVDTPEAPQSLNAVSPTTGLETAPCFVHDPFSHGSESTCDIDEADSDQDIDRFESNSNDQSSSDTIRWPTDSLSKTIPIIRKR